MDVGYVFTSKKFLILFLLLSGILPTCLIAQSTYVNSIPKEDPYYTDSQSKTTFLLTSAFQKVDETEESIHWPAFLVTSSVLAGTYAGLFIYEQDHRWNLPKIPFYFSNNWDTKGFDKFGHFYATKSQAFLISNLYRFSNIRPPKSNLLGAGIALTVQSVIEIKDGRISGEGFDLYDQVANLLGIAWFYGKENSAFLDRFNFRWFYYPSEEKKLLQDESARFIQDYNGHSYWLSMQVGDLIPYWPRFIVPATGITLNNWLPEQNQPGYYSYHFSFNLDFTHIIPQHSTLGKLSADLLNGFYIPAPAIELYPDWGFELLFSIDI